MGQAVEGGAGEQVVAEDLGPFGESAVTGDDEGAALVTLADDFVQILSGLGAGQREEAEVVEDEQVEAEEFGKEAGMRATGAGGVQVGEQALGGAIEDAQVTFQGFDGQPIAEMTFPRASGAGQE